MFEKIEANASAGQDDEILYKRTSLSPAEGELARICKLFDADVDVDNSSDMQEDSSAISEGAVTIVKDELVLDDEDDESSIDYDDTVAASEDRSNEKSTEAESPSSTSGVKIKVENSEENVEIKKRKIDALETKESEDLTKLLKQQTTVISTISKFLTENVIVQTENLRVMNEIRQGLKEVCESIKTLSDVTHDTLKEQRRHNYEIEKLQREEVLLAKQQLELEELKVFGSRMRE